MLSSVLLAALTIAFPSAGRNLPAVSRVYVIGAVDAGVTNIIVQGRDVPVYRTGAWGTLVDVVPGTNFVQVAESNHWFVVAPKPSADPVPAKPPKPYAKLAYAQDAPVPRPADRAPGEFVVWLDPGHGGDDTGARSPHGWYEKSANLALASELRDALRRRGITVKMTREDDRALPLDDRPKAAHTEGADAFVSVHHNAPAFDRDPTKARYFSVYAWNGLGTELAAALAKGAGGSLAPGLADHGVLKANFAVTRSPQIPSCLVEADFITHPAGEESAWDPVAQRTLAEGLAQGLADWCAARRTE